VSSNSNKRRPAPTAPRSAKPRTTAKATTAGSSALAAPGGPALTGALASLLEPIAALAVARGLPFASVEDLLKAAFVEAAREAQPPEAGQRIVSRVATATGLTRREVTRLLVAEGGLPPPRPSPATQVFTRWRADPALKNRRGQPISLPRQGAAPSFEALARSVTQDVHPRSLLDELCRLGLVSVEGDTVKLLRDSVVAAGDTDRAYGFLGGNVGDHLRAAVANVLAETPPHVEQAVFADELSAESMAAFRDIAKAQWQTLLAATVPALQSLIDADAAAARVRDRRVRIGLYTWNDVMVEAAPARRRAGTSAGTTPGAARRAPKKER
jgi:hypothetical protein